MILTDGGQLWRLTTGCKKAKSDLVAALEQLAEHEIENNSSLLSKERRIAAALIEGAAERTDLYKVAELDVDGFVGELIKDAEKTLRDIRRKDVGEEQAQNEEERGRKTDADYASEAYERRQARQLAREEEVRQQLKREAEEREQRAEEARRKKEESEMREREWAEREALKRAERNKQHDLEREKERKRNECHNKKRECEPEREDRSERRYREQEVARKAGHVDINHEIGNMQSRNPSSKQVDEKDLEKVALELLLREGQELAAKSKVRSELERQESLEPPSHDRRYEKGAEREYFRSVHELDEHHDRSPSKIIKGVEVQYAKREAPRRSSNIRGRSPDVQPRSLTPKMSGFPDQSHSPRKRQRTRSRSLEDIDRYVPSSVRNQNKDRDSPFCKSSEQLHRSRREEDRKMVRDHRNSLDSDYHRKGFERLHVRENELRGQERSWDRERDHENRSLREYEKRKTRDIDRERRTSWERNRDRSAERDRNRLRDYDRDSNEKDRFRGRADDRGRERYHYEDHKPIRRRSRERSQYRNHGR